MQTKTLALLILYKILFSSHVNAQVPFSCTDGPFIVGTTTSQPAPNLYRINTASIPFNFTTVSSSSGNTSYNAIGYRISDNLIYGIEESGVGSSSAQLIQIDATGTALDLGVITGLPVDRYISGDFDTNGTYYVSNEDNSGLYVIDVDTRTVTNQFSYATNYRFSDISYNPQDDMLYAVTTINTLAPDLAGQLLRIDPGTGNLTTVGTASGASTGVGSLSFDANGTLYAVDNLSAAVYRINTNNGDSTFVSSSPQFSRADSAHCANAVFPDPRLAMPTAVPTLRWFGLMLLVILMFCGLAITSKKQL